MKALRPFETSELRTERHSITSQKTWYFFAAIMQDVLGWSHDPDGRGLPQTSGTSASLRLYSS